MNLILFGNGQFASLAWYCLTVVTADTEPDGLYVGVPARRAALPPSRS